ncbi:hypothetical protein [Mycobacterium paraense]|uniref:hypothetical protein n=1 Tax=Mycobacterium paraense TaxID=767916 RepID=UPI00111C0D16|nr:hypothetical protein [Mycobacterium paraense]
MSMIFSLCSHQDDLSRRAIDVNRLILGNLAHDRGILDRIADENNCPHCLRALLVYAVGLATEYLTEIHGGDEATARAYIETVMTHALDLP